MGMFANAKTITAETKTSKRKGAELPATPLTGLEYFAALKAAIVDLEALAAVEETALKALMTDKFLLDGCAAKDRPVNFKALISPARTTIAVPC